MSFTIRNYIDGLWSPSSGREFVSVINPANAQTIDWYPLGGLADVAQAAATAQ